MQTTYIMSCVGVDYMLKCFQYKNCVGSSPNTKKCVASFLVPVYKSEQAINACSDFLLSEHTCVLSLPFKVFSILFDSFIVKRINIVILLRNLQIIYSIFETFNLSPN